MTTHEIIREYFPDATDSQCHDATWVCTGFPSFWHIPRDGNTPEECFRKQIADARAKSANIEEAIAICDAEFTKQADKALRELDAREGSAT